MITAMLEELISPVQSEAHNDLIQAGDKVRLVSGVSNLLTEYQKEYPAENEHWLKMARIVNEVGRNYFSVLHVADERSAYPIGTIVIEIAPNEDIEVHSSILEKI